MRAIPFDPRRMPPALDGVPVVIEAGIARNEALYLFDRILVHPFMALELQYHRDPEAWLAAILAKIDRRAAGRMLELQGRLDDAQARDDALVEWLDAQERQRRAAQPDEREERPMTNIYQPGTRGDAEREAAASLVTEADPIDGHIVGLIADAHGAAIQKAVEDFYAELDTIAASNVDAALPGVIEGREWLAAINFAIGDPMDGYHEWMQETWEPLASEPDDHATPGTLDA